MALSTGSKIWKSTQEPLWPTNLVVLHPLGLQQVRPSVVNPCQGSITIRGHGAPDPSLVDKGRCKEPLLEKELFFWRHDAGEIRTLCPTSLHGPGKRDLLFAEEPVLKVAIRCPA